MMCKPATNPCQHRLGRIGPNNMQIICRIISRKYADNTFRDGHNMYLICGQYSNNQRIICGSGDNMQIICGCGMEVRALVGGWAEKVGVGGAEIWRQVEGG